ncbi:MAG: ASCH domain-containing protein [Blastocatellia bacterium]
MEIGLSIRQPWTELILQGRKTIEVRTWPTKHRGRLLLHAAARPDSAALKAFGLNRGEFVYGALVGECELYECSEFTESTWESLRQHHLNLGAFTRGQYAWLLRSSSRIGPILFKGRLGLMRIETTDSR